MKKSLIALALIVSFVLIRPAYSEEVKNLSNLDLTQLAKAAEFLKKYPDLARDPEKLKVLMRLAESFKNKQQQK